MDNEIKKRDDELIIAELKAAQDNLNSFNYMNGNVWEIKHLANKILELLIELKGSDDPDVKMRASQSISAVAHTIGKEVSYIDSHYRAMVKKNAPKVRRKDYENSVDRAIRQLNVDIYF